MSPATVIGHPLTTPDHLRRLRGAVVATALVLLASLVVLALMVNRQASQVARAIAADDAVTHSEVRLITHAQHGTVLMASALRDTPLDDSRLDELSAAVQTELDGLSDPRATAFAARWATEVAPAIAAVDASSPVDAAAQAADAASRVDRFESELDGLVAELDASLLAADESADRDTDELQTTTERVRVGILLVSAGLLFTVAAAAYLFGRVDRQRATTLAALAERDSETRQLSLVARATDNLVVITDASGRIEWVNDAFVLRTGYQLDEVAGRTPGSFLQGEDSDPAVVARMREAMQRAQSFHVEIVNYDRSGEAYWVDIEAQPVLDCQGRVTNYIAVERDVTKRHALEDHLRQMKDDAEALAAAKSNFLTSMSHEIRTPLNAVLGLTELLLTTELDDRQRDYVETANQSGAFLLELLNNILDFSALEAGRGEVDEQPFDVRDLLTRVTATLGPEAERRHLRLSMSVDGDVPATLSGDATRIQQILVNLASNAVKFTEHGGVNLRASWSADELTVEVRDSGIGIAPDRLERVFEPFGQADGSIAKRYGGSGLGLAISRHLAQIMRGSLRLESQEYVGTTAILVIPAPTAQRPAEARVVGSDAPARDTSAPAILVAEDDAVNRQVAEHMLRRLGYRADFVHDGAAAVDACRNRHYDLVFMDVQMPELDGVAATRHIRRDVHATRQPVIVALTASALVGDRERFIAAGMDGYLSKPVQLRDLADAIDEACRFQQSERTYAAIRSTAPSPNVTVNSRPVDIDPLVDRLGTEAAQSALDVLLPVFLGQTNHAIPELRAALHERNQSVAERLIADAIDSGSAIEATGVVEALHLLGAAVRAGRWSSAMTSFDDVIDELDVLRSWYVDRSVQRVVAC